MASPSDYRRSIGDVLLFLFLSLGCLLAPAHAQVSEEAPSRHGGRISVGDAAVLGVVEGLTEYLPVSSTGHLILASHFMGLSRFEETPDGAELVKAPALDAFEIVIQVGAILAVLGLYHRHVRRILMGLLGRDSEGLRLLGLLIVAFLPSAVLGVLFRDSIKALLFNPLTVAVALALGGVAMIAVDRFWYRREQGGRAAQPDLFKLSCKGALVIGLFQCLALCPGTSRSMVTIVGGVLVGLNMVAAAEFSFLLALPTLGGATVYEGISELSALTHEIGLVSLAVGIGVSWIVAAATVKGLVKWLTSHGLTPFGAYRLLVAAVVLMLFLV